ncbi:hypothetical protein CRUP_011400, partial [Coryphaenoides rupestris]
GSSASELLGSVLVTAHSRRRCTGAQSANSLAPIPWPRYPGPCNLAPVPWPCTLASYPGPVPWPPYPGPDPRRVPWPRTLALRTLAFLATLRARTGPDQTGLESNQEWKRKIEKETKKLKGDN